MFDAFQKFTDELNQLLEKAGVFLVKSFPKCRITTSIHQVIGKELFFDQVGVLASMLWSQFVDVNFQRRLIIRIGSQRRNQLVVKLRGIVMQLVKHFMGDEHEIGTVRVYCKEDVATVAANHRCPTW